MLIGSLQRRHATSIVQKYSVGRDDAATMGGVFMPFLADTLSGSLSG